jgi:hypothetical protein
MQRRDCLRTVGAMIGTVSVAGCSSETSEDQSTDGTGGRQSTGSVMTGSTANRTTTVSAPTPDPPANRLLRPIQLGESWEYTDESMPTITESGTITAVYRTTRNYTRTIRTRLWPCEGETLDALGGTCSLGGLPERYRSMEDVETTTLPIGETAFAWWSGPKTDIEVVSHQHVFRMTQTPLPEQTRTTNTDAIPSRDARLAALSQIARQQVEKLARVV